MRFRPPHKITKVVTHLGGTAVPLIEKFRGPAGPLIEKFRGPAGPPIETNWGPALAPWIPREGQLTISGGIAPSSYIPALSYDHSKRFWREWEGWALLTRTRYVGGKPEVCLAYFCGTDTCVSFFLRFTSSASQ